MVSFTVVVGVTLAASIANASPIPYSNAVPSATTTEAGLLPVYTPTGSPVLFKMSERHDHCEGLSDKAMDGIELAHHDKNGAHANGRSPVMNTIRYKHDEPAQPLASGSAELPQPESRIASGSNSAADYQQVMKGHGLDAAPGSESAAHYQQYRTSHGFDAADSDRAEKGKSEGYENDDRASLDLRHPPHHHHQKREGSDCSIAAGKVLCKVKQDAEPGQDFEASNLDPDIPTHIADID